MSGISVGISGLGLSAGCYSQAVAAADTQSSPTDATAVIAFNSTGLGTRTGAAGFTWLIYGLSGDVQIFVTGTGDTPTGSALDTWLTLSSNRSWTLTEAGIGSKNFTGTYTLRHRLTTQTLGSGTFTLDADVNP